MILIDPVRLDTFLCDRSSPSRALVESPGTATDDTNAPLQNHVALLDVLPMPVENAPNDAMWRALVLVLQRELDDANKAREARLLDLLDQTTEPIPSPSRRLKVDEMALLHPSRHQNSTSHHTGN